MSGEEEEAPKRTSKAGLGRRRDYTGRGGRPLLHEKLESGAQDEPTGKGTEKTRIEERQHRRDRRQYTVEQPRGRREAKRRDRMEGSGSTTPKPQGTVKTRRTGTRSQAEERARKTTQSPGQSRKNGLGGRHGKQKSWIPARRRDRATTGCQPPRNRRDTNRRLTRKIRRRNSRVDGTKDRHRSLQGQPPEGRGAGSGKSREREGRRRTKRPETWSAGQKQAGSEPSTSLKAMNTQQDTRATHTRGEQTTNMKTTTRGLHS